MRPTVGQTSAPRTAGDGGYRILVSGQQDNYIPHAVYTISLQGNVVCRCVCGCSFRNSRYSDVERSRPQRQLINYEAH